MGELNLFGMKKAGEPFCAILKTSDASSGVIIKESDPVRRIWIENICILSGSNSKWLKITDGTTDIICSIVLEKGIKFEKTFLRPVGCVEGASLFLISEAIFDIMIIVEGYVDEPVPSSSVSSSVSASPSI